MQHNTSGPEGREQLCLDARGSVQSKPEAKTQEQRWHRCVHSWSSLEHEPEAQDILLS